MKNVGTILAAVFLAIVLLLYMCTFQVRFTEVAIKKTWGRPADDAIVEPGLKLKWPYPIHQLERIILLLPTRILRTRLRPWPRIGRPRACA